MRLSASEKADTVRLVIQSDLGIKRTLERLGINRATFYNWYRAYAEGGEAALEPKRRSREQWNRIPDPIREMVVDVALDNPELSSRELACTITDELETYISESSVYRILRDNGLTEPQQHEFLMAADEFRHKTKFQNEMWQTDFTYFRVIGWGWYYLSTILDDFSRFIHDWELCTTMNKEDVMRCVDRAVEKAGIPKGHPPKLLSDNGPCYIAADLGEYLENQYGMKQVHGAPLHPQTQGKIERYHRSMKNVIKLQNYYSPDELREAIAAWVEYYNYHRYHESLGNLTPADVYFGRGEAILKKREELKRKAYEQRREIYYNDKLNTKESDD